MTNEVAIKAMTKYMPKGNDSVSLVLREAMNMGIKALEQIPDLKDAYDKGYKDGQEALAFHLELCKEEQESCEDRDKMKIYKCKLNGLFYVVTEKYDDKYVQAINIEDKYSYTIPIEDLELWLEFDK